MKNNKKYHDSTGMKLARFLLVILTLIYPVFMVMMSGAGLIANRASYGEKIFVTGIMLIASGAAMTLGTFLCIIRKNIPAVIFSGAGFIVCMLMLYRLVSHADSNGWSDPLTMVSVSGMYASRIAPSGIAVILTVGISLIQFFSYEAEQKRHELHREKTDT